MPISRSSASASATISRYRGSKMCRGRKTFGKSTIFGSGKSGRRSDTSVNRFGLLVQVVHQHVLPERVRRREVGLPLADLRHAPDKAHEIVVAGEHEGVDHDAAP